MSMEQFSNVTDTKDVGKWVRVRGWGDNPFWCLITGVAGLYSYNILYRADALEYLQDTVHVDDVLEWGCKMEWDSERI